MSIIEKLQKINSDYKHASQVRNQARSLSLLSAGIYTEAERFVYELLQNAIDAFVDVDSDRLDIRIDIVGDYFVFMHNGAAFSDSDIEGLCSVGNGNKTKNVQKVGYKGIGFKAVFIQSSLVYIQSGKDLCFKFDKKACFNLLSGSLKEELTGINGPLYDDVPWQIIPIDDRRPLDINTDGFNVVIYIKMPRLGELLPRIVDLLKDKEFLLFLKANHVSVSLFNNNNLITRISRVKDGDIVKLSVNEEIQCRWLMHSESVAITPEVREYISQNISSVPEKLREANQIEVTFSVKVGDNGELVPLHDTMVYTYLPTSYGNLGIPFIINANFITDAGRQQLQKDSEWNKLIFRETPRLFLKWMATLSHRHREYYKILPKRHAKLPDELTSVFFSSLSAAIREIPFLPSAMVPDKTILVPDAYIDRIEFAEVLGSKKFLLCVNELFGHSYGEDNKVSDVDSSILTSYGVKVFDSTDVLRLLIDGKVLSGISVDENFKLISFLCRRITSPEDVEALGPVAFLLDDTNSLAAASDLILPSSFKDQNEVAGNVRTLNASLYGKLKDTDELRWLHENFGLKEMSNLGFVEYILKHPDYVNVDNAISVGRFVFQAWKKENVLERSEISKNIKRVKFLTARRELKPIVNLYLGSKYQPQHDLESVDGELGIFISSEYPEPGDRIEDWTFFLKRCGASDSVGISQRILDAETTTDKGCTAEDLKPYPMLKDAAIAFYSLKHAKSKYVSSRGCCYSNPIIQKQIAVSYFTYIDPSKSVSRDLERYILNIGLSQLFRPEDMEDEIFGRITWWDTAVKDSLFKHVSSRYKTFIEYALAEKQLFPTSMGDSRLAKDVFINSSDIVRLAGPYLPILDISNTVHDSWRKILPFHYQLTLEDYLMALDNIATDTENAKNNKDRISLLYQALILSDYHLDERIREWGKTHKILSRNNEFVLPSELSYITISGFKCNSQAYCRVERHCQDRIVELLRTLGVRIIDKVVPEFASPQKVEGLKDGLFRNIAYVALIKSQHTKSDYEACVKEIEGLIKNCEFWQCEKIDLSYGDDVDKISRTTYAEENQFYYVGELGISKSELLMAALCKYLGLKDKDKELFVVLISRTSGELDDYFREKGYDENLLDKARRSVIMQNTPPSACGVLSNQSDAGNFGIVDPCEQESAHGGSSAENSPGAASGADQAARTDDNVGSGANKGQCCKIGDEDVDPDEYLQFSQIFSGGDSADNDDVQKKQDESKLACLRLFNQLEAQHLEPSMDGHREIDYVVRELYAGLGKTGPNIDINTGERLHVISAMGGVGYIPPRWWNKVVNKENGVNVICAVTGVSKENCVLIRSYSDLLSYVGENAIPVKIRGENAEERVRIATNWFSSVDVSGTAGRIYALLKLREKTLMNSAFAKGFCDDEMPDQEASGADNDEF